MDKVPQRDSVHLKLDRDLVRSVDLLAVLWDSYRNETVERLLKESLEKYETALQKIREVGREL
ncbi:MAG TPA: hypothetical protein VJN32_02050 [Dehalococcoidia bacterium]|nr:hypothetical protein [Dehalococcoidia bacterium]